MTFHGGSEVDQVIDTMDFAVYAYDVEHIIVDNLQVHNKDMLIPGTLQTLIDCPQISAWLPVHVVSRR